MKKILVISHIFECMEWLEAFFTPGEFEITFVELVESSTTLNNIDVVVMDVIDETSIYQLVTRLIAEYPNMHVIIYSAIPFAEFNLSGHEKIKYCNNMADNLVEVIRGVLQPI